MRCASLTQVYVGFTDERSSGPSLLSWSVMPLALCGATQHSNTDPFDKTSPGIPIGPHWMILWPYDAKRCGLPNTVRDEGAWVMFDGTPYAYLHICGTPWIVNEYGPGQEAIWTMRYGRA